MDPDLIVFIGGAVAGSARRVNRNGPVMFEYDDAYLAEPGRTPLSVGVPPHPGARDIRAWLDNLLPDDITVRRRWMAEQQATGIDPVSLLSTSIGLDCAGAVQFCPPGRLGDITGQDTGVEWHSEAEVADWIRTARSGSRGARISRRGRYSLGGYQTKIALYHEEGQWGSPSGRLPTTHILKPGLDSVPGYDLSDGDLVEHACMAAANHLGMNVATTRLARFEGERVLVVERYDRIHDGDDLHRVHQEDLCQALGRPSSLKYQSDGGPSPIEIAAVIRSESVAPQEDLIRFADALIYNWAIAATDAHAKNYSLLLDGDNVVLAPLYDLISHLPYRVGDDPAALEASMSFEDDYLLASADRPGSWRAAAEAMGADPDLIEHRAETILRGCPEAFDTAIDGLSPTDRASPKVAALGRDIQARCLSVLRSRASPRAAR